MTETTAIRKGHEFDTAALEAFLMDAAVAKSPLALVRQFSFGQSNPTYLLTFVDTSQFVLRMKPKNVKIATAHAVDREFKVIRALYAAGFPVPRAFVLEPEGRILGSPFYVMEFVNGSIYTNPQLPELCREHRRAVFLGAVQTLAKLHAYKPDELGLATFGPTATEYYARQITRLLSVSLSQAEFAPALTGLGEAIAWFTANMPPSETALIHGDYKLDNIIYHTSHDKSLSEPFGRCHAEDGSTLTVRAVLDWEMSTIGHPLSDLANLCSVYWLPPIRIGDSDGGLAGVGFSLESDGIPSEQELVMLYAKQTGRHYPLSGWNFCKAFWFFKYAVIAQGIQARVAQGNASSPAASAAGAVAPMLMEMCLIAIQDDGVGLTKAKL